jgi:hypothetical protein
MTELWYPKKFVAAFAAARQNTTTPAGTASSPVWTQWFGERMQDIARAEGLYCQNHQHPSSPGEWMNIDHAFVEDNDYADFPIVGVEHENGGLGSKAGELPEAQTGEYIEWAYWKTLALRCRLSVLVAYPYVGQKAIALAVLGKMASRWMGQHRAVPNSLVLFGWWRNDDTGPEDAGTIYDAYVTAAVGDPVALVPLA